MFNFLSTSIPQVLFSRAALSPFILHPVLILVIVLSQVYDLALGLVELHDVHTGPFLKLIQVPLDDIPSLSLSTVPFCLVSSANLLRVHSTPLSGSLMKILKDFMGDRF